MENRKFPLLSCITSPKEDIFPLLASLEPASRKFPHFLSATLFSPKKYIQSIASRRTMQSTPQTKSSTAKNKSIDSNKQYRFTYQSSQIITHTQLHENKIQSQKTEPPHLSIPLKASETPTSMCLITTTTYACYHSTTKTDPCAKQLRPHVLRPSDGNVVCSKIYSEAAAGYLCPMCWCYYYGGRHL